MSTYNSHLIAKICWLKSKVILQNATERKNNIKFAFKITDLMFQTNAKFGANITLDRFDMAKMGQSEPWT